MSKLQTTSRATNFWTSNTQQPIVGSALLGGRCGHNHHPPTLRRELHCKNTDQKMGTAGSGCGREGSDTAAELRDLQTPPRHTRTRDHRSISPTPAYTHMHCGHTRATLAASMLR